MQRIGRRAQLIKPKAHKKLTLCDKHNMNTIAPEHRTSCTTSSFASSSANPPSSDYTSNQSSNYTPRPSPIVEDPIAFPFPTLLQDMNPEKRPSPVRRASKLNLLSKLFSGSKRDLKESKKPFRDLGKEKGTGTTNKTTSPTTFHLSRDAAQVFGTLTPPLGMTATTNNKRGLVRQTSESSMIGSVLEIPSSSTTSSTLEETAEEVPPVVLEATCSPARPKLSQRAASFRTPCSRKTEFHRAPSTRSVSFQTEPERLKPPPPPPLPAKQPIPSTDNPSVEISPGNFQVLRGHKETLHYVRRDKVASTTCLCCNDTIYSIDDAEMVVCPNCRSISPTQIENGHGLALGFSAHEWLDVQRESGMTMP